MHDVNSFLAVPVSSCRLQRMRISCLQRRSTCTQSHMTFSTMLTDMYFVKVNVLTITSLPQECSAVKKNVLGLNIQIGELF